MNKLTITAVIMLAIGVGGGYFLRNTLIPADKAGISSESHDMHGSTTVDNKGEILFYRNPMKPMVTSPVPARDSMGMDYVPVYADSGSNGDEPVGTVTIDPVVIQNIGVRTAEARHSNLSRTIRAVGMIEFNEEHMTRIHPKTSGWIEELYVDKTGENIKENTILLSIYSPKLVSTQQEYLLALNGLELQENSPFPGIRQGAAELLNSTYERLKLFDVPEHQISELEETGKIQKSLHIHSPVAGTVIRIGSREGQYVTPSTELYMIADLSKIWVYADIYEYEISWVKVGDKVEMSLAGIPGRTFMGNLAYIYPYAESKTRTIKVRLEFDNPDLLLRPKMFAEIKISAQEQKQAVVIPSEAVVRSGVRDQVFVVRDKGKFEPRTVKLGLESGGEVIVLTGIEAGETVVTSAQFLIDSESKLSEATAKMMDALKQKDIELKDDHSGHDNKNRVKTNE